MSAFQAAQPVTLASWSTVTDERRCHYELLTIVT
jgi:hypothetical protein